jgi:hypothetical protein
LQKSLWKCTWAFMFWMSVICSHLPRDSKQWGLPASICLPCSFSMHAAQSTASKSKIVFVKEVQAEFLTWHSFVSQGHKNESKPITSNRNVSDRKFKTHYF